MTDENPLSSATPVRTLQIIVTAMAVGAATFLAIAWIVPSRPILPTMEEGRPPVLSYAALVFGAAAILGGQMIANLITTAGRRKLAGRARPVEAGRSVGDSPAPPGPEDVRSALLMLFTTRTIMGAAIDEAAALVLALAFLLEGQSGCAALGGVMVFALLLRIPSKDRAARWLAEQQRLLDQEPPR